MVHGLLSGFEQLGFETCYFPCRSWMIIGYEEGVKILENDLKEANCDLLVFGGIFPSYFMELPRLCKKYNCKYMYWSIEDPCNFKDTLKMCKEADYVFTTTYECIKKYKAKGIEANLLLFACNPEYHCTGLYNPDYSFDWTLQASYYKWSARQHGFDLFLLNAILEATKNVGIYGAGWSGVNGQNRLGNFKDKYYGYFPNNRLGDLCASSKVILGVQCDDSSITQTSMRPFEILSCGGFHLTQWTKATCNLFDDGKHLLTTKSLEETIEILKYYLDPKHDSERLRIAKNGFEYVRKYHTYKHRVIEDIMPIIGKDFRL